MPACHMMPLCCEKSRAQHVLPKAPLCLPSEPHDGAIAARHSLKPVSVSFEVLNFTFCTVGDLVTNEQTMRGLTFVSFLLTFPLLMSFLNNSKIKIYIWLNPIIY